MFCTFMMLYRHAVLVVLRDVQICSGMVLVCTMITNPSSSTGSNAKRVLIQFLFDIRVKVIYFGRKQTPSTCFRIFIMIMMKSKTFQKLLKDPMNPVFSTFWCLFKVSCGVLRFSVIPSTSVFFIHCMNGNNKIRLVINKTTKKRKVNT